MRNEIKKLTDQKLQAALDYHYKRIENIEAVKVEHPEFVEGEEEKVRDVLSLLQIEKMRRES